MEASRYARKAASPLPESPKKVDVDPSPATAESSVPDAAPVAIQVPDMGAFAQTRPPDDLFSDDFTPLDEPVVEAPSPFIPTTQGSQDVAGVQSAQVPQQRQSRRQQHPRNNQKQPYNTVQTPISPTSTNEPGSPTATRPNQQGASARGDRSATGGQTKPKLTSEELDEKMKAMKLKNTELEQAHARSQADAESFRVKEAAVKERQKQDTVNRQAMLSEREKNAQRKMQAQNRDWDAGKDESDIIDRPHRRPMRGAYGGVARDGPVAHNAGGMLDDEPHYQNEMSHRGAGRGRGRGRGGGRGGRGGGRGDGQEAQSVPAASDFPSLDNAATKPAPANAIGKTTANIDTSVGNSAPKANRVDSYGADFTPGEKTSWADQMETPITPAWQTDNIEAKAPKSGW